MEVASQNSICLLTCSEEEAEKNEEKPHSGNKSLATELLQALKLATGLLRAPEPSDSDSSEPSDSESSSLLPNSSEPSSPLTSPSDPSSAWSFLACQLPHLSRSEVGRDRYAAVRAANCPVIDCQKMFLQTGRLINEQKA